MDEQKQIRDSVYYLHEFQIHNQDGLRRSHSYKVVGHDPNLWLAYQVLSHFSKDKHISEEHWQKVKQHFSRTNVSATFAPASCQAIDWLVTNMDEWFKSQDQEKLLQVLSQINDVYKEDATD